MKTPLNKNRFWQMGILTLLIGSASQVAFANSPYLECQCVKEDVDTLETMTLHNYPVSCASTPDENSLIDSDGNAINGAELSIKRKYSRIRLAGDELISTGTSPGNGTYDVGSRNGWELNWIEDSNDGNSKQKLSGNGYKAVTTALVTYPNSAYEYTLGKLTVVDSHNANTHEYEVAAIWQTSTTFQTAAVAVCLGPKLSEG